MDHKHANTHTYSQVDPSASEQEQRRFTQRQMIIYHGNTGLKPCCIGAISQN